MSATQNLWTGFSHGNFWTCVSHAKLSDSCQLNWPFRHMSANFWTCVSHGVSRHISATLSFWDICQPHWTSGHVSALNFWIYVTHTDFQTHLNQIEFLDTCQPRWTVSYVSATVFSQLHVSHAEQSGTCPPRWTFGHLSGTLRYGHVWKTWRLLENKRRSLSGLPKKWPPTCLQDSMRLGYLITKCYK